MFCASPSRRWALFSCGSCRVYGNRRTLLSAQWMIEDAWQVRADQDLTADQRRDASPDKSGNLVAVSISAVGR